VPYLLNVLYLLLIALASPWLVYQSLRKGKYREGFAEKFLGRVPCRQSNRPCLWLHAVSVGEVNLLASILAEIGRRQPDCECVISTTTMAGYALAKKKYAGLTVFYAPLDFSWAVRAAMRRIRPSCLVLAELELWPNIIRAAQEHGARVAIINGRLSEHSFRGYRRFRPLVARLLGQIDLIAAQNDEYAERFLALGARRETVQVTGSMKFDGAQTDRNNSHTLKLRSLAGFDDRDMVLLAGSTQDPEEALALATFKELAPAYPRLRLVLVPRHPDRFEAVAQLLAASGLAWQRRSRLEGEGGNLAARVLLVDAIGELGAWWGTAQIGFVGGSLGQRGGQNMIEPAAYGAAVSFGPNTWNFRDIVAMLLDRKAALVVRDGSELTAFVRRCLDDPRFAGELGSHARELVESQLGATRRTWDLLAPLVCVPARSAAQRTAA
jgi:3-deoxy-D-manno-octulosonic-acid transferase